MATAARPPSRTAVLTAVARGLDTGRLDAAVLDDPFALPLVGEEGEALLERLKRELPQDRLAQFSRWIRVRARLAEDTVERAVSEGVRQYVVLGAGLDSFAYRRADLLDRLRVFEVDQPASQAWKRARLRALAVDIPENLVFAPVDFETQTLREGLEAAGFDFQAPAVFSWIGVTMYLTLAAIEATLRTVAACRTGTRLVLTYNLPPSVLREAGLGTKNWFADLAAEMGEPFISLFSPAAIEALLQRLGFEDIVQFGPDDALRSSFAGHESVRLNTPQRVVTARVAPHEAWRRLYPEHRGRPGS